MLLCFSVFNREQERNMYTHESIYFNLSRKQHKLVFDNSIISYVENCTTCRGRPYCFFPTAKIEYDNELGLTFGGTRELQKENDVAIPH